MTIDPRIHRIVAAQPYRLLFATISGAHLYGFPSPDSVGVSYITVYRLMQRGLLRGSSAVRTKLIPRREIERFLEKTMPHP